MSRSECRETANKEASQSVCGGAEGESSAALALSTGKTTLMAEGHEPRTQKEAASAFFPGAAGLGAFPLRAPSHGVWRAGGHWEGALLWCFNPLLLETALRQNYNHILF